MRGDHSIPDYLVQKFFSRKRAYLVSHPDKLLFNETFLKGTGGKVLIQEEYCDDGFIPVSPRIIYNDRPIHSMVYIEQ